jgi:hypothetical protein
VFLLTEDGWAAECSRKKKTEISSNNQIFSLGWNGNSQKCRNGKAGVLHSVCIKLNGSLHLTKQIE